MKKFYALLLALLCAAALSVPCFAAPYVAYWGFEGNANEAYNGLTPSNPDAFTSVEGKNGQGFANAAGTAGVLHTNADIPMGSNFTFSMWVKSAECDDIANYCVLVAKNPKGQDGHFEVYWDPQGCFSTYNTAADGTALELHATQATRDGEWHHYIILCENGEYLLYIDGEFDATGFFEQVDAPGSISFGGLVDDTLPAGSTIDDVFFANIAIPEKDIPSLMNDTAGYAAKLTGKEAASTTPAETAPAGETAPAPAETTPPAEEAQPSAPQTADTLLVSVVMLAAAAAAVTVKRRR